MTVAAWDSERQPLDQVHARLHEAGVEPGPDGYDVAALNAAIASRGLMPATIEGGPEEYKAVLAMTTGTVASRSAVGYGARPEDALARALDAYIRYMAPGA